MSGLINRDDVVFIITHQRSALLEAAVRAAPHHAEVLRDMAGWWSDLSDAVKKLADQSAPPEAGATWIPVSERPLPKDITTFLVANDKGQVAPHIRGVIHNNAGSSWDWDYGEAITHWMPMPAAPLPQNGRLNGNPKGG